MTGIYFNKDSVEKWGLSDTLLCVALGMGMLRYLG